MSETTSKSYAYFVQEADLNASLPQRKQQTQSQSSASFLHRPEIPEQMKERLKDPQLLKDFSKEIGRRHFAEFYQTPESLADVVESAKLNLSGREQRIQKMKGE